MTLLQLLQRVARPGRQPTRSVLTRANAARDAKRWSEAASAYRDFLTLWPDRADIWVQYGHALKENGQREEAELAYRRAIELAPNVSDTHLQLGHLLKITQRLDAASESYLKALQLDPNDLHSRRELQHMARSRGALSSAARQQVLIRLDPPDKSLEAPEDLGSIKADLRRIAAAVDRLTQAREIDASLSGPMKDLLAQIDAAAPPAPPEAASGSILVFDLADLFSYFRNARLPTGIQRVQIELVRALLLSEEHRGAVRICCFTEQEDEWREIPAKLFLKLAELALSGGDVQAPEWRAILNHLEIHLLRSPDFEFPERSCLINLGTSWWLQNYFLKVRTIKQTRGVRYIPFVHDMIPIMTPEHCVRELTQDFISWVVGVFDHADSFLVNSQATKRDLITVAARLGHEVAEEQITVTPLDADFRAPGRQPADPVLLDRWRLRPDAYVLFVSTIESRKNHIGAFNAWLALIRKHGTVPMLVCVGSEGWLNQAVHARLASSPELQTKVLMLSRLADEELACLYQHCMFTLYPSHYEGWGLPVTESLCYGKPTLISDSTSLPEAGGIFADYFRAGSDASLTEAAEKLILNPDYRRRRERQIATQHHPRSWADIGLQVHQAAQADSEQAFRKVSTVKAAQPGVYYPLIRNAETRIWRGMTQGEMFRAGAGWWWPDDWGAWTKPRGGEISLSVAGPHGPLKLYLQLHGLREVETRWSLALSAPSPAPPLSGVLAPNQRRWIAMDLPASEEGLVIRGVLRSEMSQNLGDFTDGGDNRVTGVGLMGLYVCEAADVMRRLALSEAISLDRLDPLTPGYEARSQALDELARS